MSRKVGLAKKIAHTLMAMSIVYSSGINIVVNARYTLPKKTKILPAAVPLLKLEPAAIIIMTAEVLLMAKLLV